MAGYPRLERVSPHFHVSSLSDVMQEAIDRPAILRDASAAIAYQRWLQQNRFEDSDVNAWRFAAQAGEHRPSESATPPLPIESARRRRRRWWVLVAATGLAVMVIGAVWAYAISSAQHWTKIDQPEASHTEMVPDGTWRITFESADVCYVGQLYWDCIDEYTSQWNYACADRAHDPLSAQICDNYYDTILEMKTAAANEPWSTVADTTGSGQLSISENLDRVRVIDRPELSHEAVCYLGFIGECPAQAADRDPASGRPS